MATPDTSSVQSLTSFVWSIAEILRELIADGLVHAAAILAGIVGIAVRARGE